jgi:hypothetical protein
VSLRRDEEETYDHRHMTVTFSLLPSRPPDPGIMDALLSSDLPDLTLISRGKVRDIYKTSSPEHLLFVASDRISAYDVVLRNVELAVQACRAVV